MYTVGGFVMADPNYLVHDGVKGMKWGVRRYQNKDGSLTQLGKEHYGYVNEKDKVESHQARIIKDLDYQAYKQYKKYDRLREKGKDEKAKRYKEKGDLFSSKAIRREKEIQAYKKLDEDTKYIIKNAVRKNNKNQALLGLLPGVNGVIGGILGAVKAQKYYYSKDDAAYDKAEKVLRQYVDIPFKNIGESDKKK